MVDEGLLHGMQIAVRAGQALDRGDLAALGRHREREAGEGASPVDMDRAGAALALVAALLGPGEADVLAQRVEQGRPHVEREVVVLPIDPQRHRHWRPRVDCLLLRLGAAAERSRHKRRRGQRSCSG